MSYQILHVFQHGSPAAPEFQIADYKFETGIAGDFKLQISDLKWGWWRAGGAI
jgi:hypothetical protein